MALCVCVCLLRLHERGHVYAKNSMWTMCMRLPTVDGVTRTIVYRSTCTYHGGNERMFNNNNHHHHHHHNNNNSGGIDDHHGTHSFLNSCINPVALYCVSGVFRQHFHRYLCCKPIQPTHHRLGLSLATNACDTSFMSTIRRPHHNHHTIVHNGSSPTQSIIMTEKRWGTILSQDTFL